MAEKTSKAKKPVEKKKSGAGKFFLGAAIGAIAGAIAGKMLSRDEDDECDCGDDCNCGDDCKCKKVANDEPAKTAKTTVKATKTKTTTKAAKTTAKATKTATTKAAATKKTTKATK